MKINNGAFNWGKLLTLVVISSSGLINFSLISNSKVQVTIFVMILLVFFYLRLFAKKIKIELRDIIFILFLCSLIIPSMVYANGITIKSISQPIFIFIYFVLYKLLQTWFSLVEYKKEELLKKFFVTNSYIILFSLIFFLIGFINPQVSRFSVELFNNANTFDLGGISVGSGDWLPRLSGFSPEPSFWSLYIALNIAVFMDIYKRVQPNYILLGINVLSLIVTFGRTGYFVFAIIILYCLVRNSIVFRWLLVLLISIVAIKLRYFYGLDADESIAQRFDSILFSFYLWTDSLYLGYGFGNFEYYSQLYHKDYRDVFSLWFNLLFSGGILSVLLFLIFLLTFYKVKRPNYLLLSIVAGWCVMPAFNLPFVWMYLAAISFKYLNKNIKVEGNL